MQVQNLTARVAVLDAKLNEPPKTPDNSSLPPSKGQKRNKPENPGVPDRAKAAGSQSLVRLIGHPDRGQFTSAAQLGKVGRISSIRFDPLAWLARDQ